MNRHFKLNINPDDLQVSARQVARCFGGSRYRITARVGRHIEAALKTARGLTAPAAVVGLYPVKTITPDGRIGLDDGHHVRLSCSAGRAKVKTLAAAVATLGMQLEQTSRHRAANGEIYESTLLDAVGTCLLEALADVCRQRLADEARQRKTFMGARMAPGLNGCDLAQQEILIRLAGADSIGVWLNPDYVMTPVKSISMFTLFTLEPTHPGDGHKCRHCDLQHCQFRMPT
jgi:cobalamin-dependent methionine synthase I